MHVEEECEQRKLAITDKGKVFLEKWLELQRLAGIEKKRKRAVPTPNLQTIKVSSK